MQACLYTRTKDNALKTAYGTHVPKQPLAHCPLPADQNHMSFEKESFSENVQFAENYEVQKKKKQ